MHGQAHNFAPRILLLALLFGSELIALSVWLDGDSLVRRTVLIGMMQDWGSWALRCLVAFAVIFVTFVYLRDKNLLGRMTGQVVQSPMKWGLLIAHCLALAIFVALSSLLYKPVSIQRADMIAVSWLVSGLSAVALGGLAFFTWSHWAQLVRRSNYMWVYALVAAISASVIGNMVRLLWQPASYLSQFTLGLTKMLLHPFASAVIVDLHTMTVGTPRFQVEIAPQCSGLEGAGLILAFGVVWLLVFRQECRFPQSLILIPLGMALMFVLNVARITALILIGNAGAREIAEKGFHSQAGWIAFSAVAVGFCLAVRRIPWFTRAQNRESLGTATSNPTAVFLMPFLMILTAGMIAGAFAHPFEWLYPLRFFAAGSVLWIFRRSYVGLNWKCGWLSVAIGAVVFVIWVGLDRFLNPTPDRGIPEDLKASSPLSTMIWITFRVLAAVVTVPLAEELAFRGFLMRRLISRKFESVSFRNCTWFALVVSSIIFGLLHGGYWLAGSIAGFLFGVSVIRRGRIGEAVVAHATANVLLACYVLSAHQWHFW
jgi:exosortase E/protease (VPEID-CTERM system)